jgi:Uncharacterized protein conserved in bacteria (DUF2171)
MEVIGAHGVHIGTVDKVEGNRIKLAKKDSGQGSHRAAAEAAQKRLKGPRPPRSGPETEGAATPDAALISNGRYVAAF